VILTPKRPRDDDKASKQIEAYTSETILTDVRVLAIDQLVQEKDGQRVVIGKVATLELTQRQSELLAAARQAGVLTLTLRSIVDAGSKQEVADDARANRFNTIRFGVSTSTFSR
jgi:pilus assembly protein CpaB